jgi:DNA processing protein
MLELKLTELPDFVQNIKDPPDQLFYDGTNLLELLKKPRIAIVGTRKPTPYGRQVTEEFTARLAELGVVIVSGLAYGIDAIAHQTALEAGGLALAVLPSPLDNILPTANRQLAQQILDQGGALVSEYPSATPVLKHFFIYRNRLMSGLADAVLVTEAAANSGTLHTAAYGLEQGRLVMAVPGSIYSAGHAGANNLLKDRAHPVTSVEDILKHLELNIHAVAVKLAKGRNAAEQALLDLMQQGISDGQQLLSDSNLEVVKFGQTLTMLEISGKIRALGANHWALS